jgi:hypothetical protein
VTCACGRPKGPRARQCRRCVCRAAQRRYEQTEKGRHTKKKYTQTERWQARNRRLNAGRIYVGQQYYGRAAPAIANRVNARIKERVSAFKQRQSNREKAQGASPS